MTNNSGASANPAPPSEPAASKKLLLRPFTRADFETLYEIDQKCYPPQMAYSRREFRWYMRLPGAETIVADFEGAVAGFILTACFERTGHIITIDVLAECRRARVGTALLDAAETSLARRGATEKDTDLAAPRHVRRAWPTAAGWRGAARGPAADP